MKTKKDYIKLILQNDPKLIIDHIIKYEQLNNILNSLKVSVLKKIIIDITNNTDKPQTNSDKSLNNTDKLQNNSDKSLNNTDKPQTNSDKSLNNTDKSQTNSDKSLNNTNKSQTNSDKSLNNTNKLSNDKLIGVHLNRENNLQKTIYKLNKLGGNSLQIFTSNPSNCQPANIEKYFKEYETIKDLNCNFVIHSSYTINIAKPINYKIIEADLKIANKYKAIGVIVHVGKHVNTNLEKCYENMITFFNYCIDFIKTNNFNTKIILETGAGQGTEMLIDIDEFINFSKQFDEKYFGLCFDTCHVWSAGFDIIEAYNKIQKYTNNLISVIHFNGSKTKKGSKKDRHANLFDNLNTIPLEKLKLFCNNLKNIMIILETPDEQDYQKEIEFIKENY